MAARAKIWYNGREEGKSNEMDDSRRCADAVISTQKHIPGAHAQGWASQLPESCVRFEMGMTLPFLEEIWPTYCICEHLLCFIADSRCIAVQGHANVCIVSGGYGAPAAVDTLETVRALGVKRVLLVGMCGGFGLEMRVGDVLVPEAILCEEGFPSII